MEIANGSNPRTSYMPYTDRQTGETWNVPMDVFPASATVAYFDFLNEKEIRHNFPRFPMEASIRCNIPAWALFDLYRADGYKNQFHEADEKKGVFTEATGDYVFSVIVSDNKRGKRVLVYVTGGGTKDQRYHVFENPVRNGYMVPSEENDGDIFPVDNETVSGIYMPHETLLLHQKNET